MATTATLTWENFPDGLVTVRLAPVPMGAFLDFMETWEASSTVAGFRAEIETFCLLAAPEWTFKDSKGKRIPRFLDLDGQIVKGTVNAWLKAVAEVPAPLPVTSTGGAPSREA